MKPRFEKPKADWAQHSDFDYGAEASLEDQGQSPRLAPPSSSASFSLTAFAVASVIILLGLLAINMYKEETRANQMATADFNYYKSHDPAKAMAVKCANAKSQADRNIWCSGTGGTRLP